MVLELFGATGGPKIGFLEFASTLAVSSDFVPKSPFFRFYSFYAARLG